MTPTKSCLFLSQVPTIILPQVFELISDPPAWGLLEEPLRWTACSMALMTTTNSKTNFHGKTTHNQEFKKKKTALFPLTNTFSQHHKDPYGPIKHQYRLHYLNNKILTIIRFAASVSLSCLSFTSLRKLAMCLSVKGACSNPSNSSCAARDWIKESLVTICSWWRSACSWRRPPQKEKVT